MNSISSLYLLAGGETPVVERTLSVLQDEFPFAKIEVLKVAVGACSVKAVPNKTFGDPVRDYTPQLTLLARESEWSAQKNHDAMVHHYDELAKSYFGISMSQVSLEIYQSFMAAHHWCHLLQIEGERNVRKRRVITPIDSFNEKLMKPSNAEIIRLANIEANAWAYDFIRQFWDKISTPDKMDYLIKTFRKEA
jgi:hypothetical protein